MFRLSPTLVALLMVISACANIGLVGEAAPGGALADELKGVKPLPLLDLTVRPGPFQLTIDTIAPDTESGATLEAVDDRGEVVGRATVAENRTALLRDLPPGPVRLRVTDVGSTSARAETEAIVVPGEEVTDPSLYAQTVLDPGFGYLRTRDGTTLSVFVSLPGPIDGGPYPTLVEYSGYEPSNPDGTDPARLLASSLGYALVQVNVRGTGCSGGSFDAFEPIQGTDGYDVIETVATQAWSGLIGMFGVSYPGIMQLQVASYRPPSLAAIAPLSTLDEVATVLYPGGIYNYGFGEFWSALVSDGADAFGQGWEQARVDGGDEQCGANQRLRVHNPDLVATVRDNPFANALTTGRSQLTNADRINVPVFLAGAWQDEQTGGRWPSLIDALSGAPSLRVLMYNGHHIDAIGPEVLASVTEFYDVYLEDDRPGAGTIVSLALSTGLTELFDSFLPIPFVSVDNDDPDEARRRYEEQAPIRVLFEQGARSPNLPVPGFEASYNSWPPAAAVPTAWYYTPDEVGFSLRTDQPLVEATASFTTDPAEGDRTSIGDVDTLWGRNPDWRWEPSGAPNSIVATSDPLGSDVVAVGPASADLWISADGPDGDIEVTVSEIAPDGSETYVQSGQLRLSRRALADTSTELRPLITALATDVSPITPGAAPVLTRVEIPPFAHVFRAGSSIRITVDTPGGSRPRWRFEVLPDPVGITLHAGPAQPSRIVLPVLAGAVAPTPRPECGTLRAQPCRPG